MIAASRILRAKSALRLGADRTFDPILPGRKGTSYDSRRSRRLVGAGPVYDC